MGRHGDQPSSRARLTRPVYRAAHDAPSKCWKRGAGTRVRRPVRVSRPAGLYRPRTRPGRATPRGRPRPRAAVEPPSGATGNRTPDLFHAMDRRRVPLVSRKCCLTCTYKGSSVPLGTGRYCPIPLPVAPFTAPWGPGSPGAGHRVDGRLVRVAVLSLNAAERPADPVGRLPCRRLHRLRRRVRIIRMFLVPQLQPVPP